MDDERSARRRAVSLRLAGRTVKHICSAVNRSEAWSHKWWDRYLPAGPQGLYELTRARHVARRIPPELGRAILSVRRRLQAHATPATRYSLIGATAILTELKALDIRPLPCERTIGRVLRRNSLTAPRVRPAPPLPRQEWPGPQARASDEPHEVDLVGPAYLKGRKHRYYIWVCKGVYDGAVCLRLADPRKMDEGLGLCLRFGVGPVFIPVGEPQFQGSVENFNGWFQGPLFRRPGDLRRELARLQEAVNAQHAHPRLGARRRRSTGAG